MNSPLSPTPVEGQHQSLNSSDVSEPSQQPSDYRSNLLPVRRLIDFEPLRQSNAPYQHGQVSPVWGQQQPLDPEHEPQLPPPPLHSEGHLLPTRRLIDSEPLRQPNATYQHGRDPPVWGQQQSLDSPDAAESPQPIFHPAGYFLPTRRRIDFEQFRRPNASLRHGRDGSVLGQEQSFEPPDASESSPPAFDIVYSNGWINEIPTRPMDYEYRMLPLQPSQQGRDSPVSRGSEPLSINGPDLFQDPREFKRRMSHGRSMSIERACKDWANELTNSASNSNPTDIDTDDLFASLENLELLPVEVRPSTEAPPKPLAKQPPNRYKISKRTREEQPEPRDDIEDVPYWLRARLGIRLPWGMVNLSQRRLPTYLVRKLKDPLRYFPSKLSFEEKSPFGNVIPKKGQIGIHPAFRTAAPENILEAERALELSKERQFLTPEEAWRSPVIDAPNSDVGRESLTAYRSTAVNNRITSSTNKFQGFERWRSERYSCSVDGKSNKSASSGQIEAFPLVDEALMFLDQSIEYPDIGPVTMFSSRDAEDQVSISVNQSIEYPDIGPVTMFSGRDVESDQGTISLNQGTESLIVASASMLYSLDMEPPIEDQVAMALGRGTESPIEDEGSEYFGQGMEYLIEDVVSRYFSKRTGSPNEDQVSVYSGQDMEYPNVGPASMFCDQDIEYLIEYQESMNSSQSIEFSHFMHEDTPLVRWFTDSGGDKFAPLGQSSSPNQDEKAKGYKRNSANFAHLPPIDFTGTYENFCSTQFGKLIIGGGLEDYDSSAEEAAQKTAEAADNSRVPTEIYGPEEHEASMQEIFAEIEQEGATQILTTWQEVYAERAEEEGGKEDGAEEEQVNEETVETVLEDSKKKMIPGPAVLLTRNHSKRKSWFGELPAERDVGRERRKTQGEESEMSGRRMSRLGGLASAREEQTQESLESSIERETQGPANLLERKYSTRVTWLGGLPVGWQKPTEETFGDSQEKIDPGLSHPLERMRSRRTSWFGGLPPEREERADEVFGDSQEKIAQGLAHPLERKRSKRASWFGGHPADKKERPKESLENSRGKLTQASVHPLERKRSKRMSWFPGHPAESEGRTQGGSEDSYGRLTQGHVHPLERKRSKRMSWFRGLPAETEERSKEDLEDSLGKSSQASVYPLERKFSKRRSWFGGIPPETKDRTEEILEVSHRKVTQGPVHPLERKRSKRMSWFGGVPVKRAEQTPHEAFVGSRRQISQESTNPSEQMRAKRVSWFGGLPTHKEKQTKKALEDSHSKITQGQTDPPERKRAKRSSWFGGLPSERERNEQRKPKGGEQERKRKRSSWFV